MKRICTRKISSIHHNKSLSWNKAIKLKGSYSQIVLFQIGFGWRAEPIATSVRIIDEHAIVGLPRIQIKNVKYLLVILLICSFWRWWRSLFSKKTFQFSSTHLTMSAASIRRGCFMYISSSFLFDLILFLGGFKNSDAGRRRRRPRIISRKTRETNI